MTGGGGKVGTTWLNEGREGGGSPDASRRPCLGRVGPRWGQSTLAPGPRSPLLPADAGRCADSAAPEQSGRTDHLGTQPGAARAGQRIEREIPRQATHPDPRGNRHGEDGSPVGGPLHHADLAHPVGAGRCRPLVERSELTDEKSCASVCLSRPLPRTLRPSGIPHPCGPTSRTEPPDLLECLLPAYSAPSRCRSPQHLHSHLSPHPVLRCSWFLFSHAHLHFSLSPTK